jgi:hypothetical protein
MLDLTTPWTLETEWPPQCCVPAFLNAALLAHKVPVVAPAVLPGMLGVRVAPGDVNPLELPVARPSEPPGVTADDASKAIAAILRDLDAPIRFRHVRLKEITFELYENVLEEALRRGLTVGVGVDYAKLAATPRHVSALHVFRITRIMRGEVTLFDDSRECKPSNIHTPWIMVEAAALAVNDGFWLIGPPSDLNFAHAPPYSYGKPR